MFLYATATFVIVWKDNEKKYNEEIEGSYLGLIVAVISTAKMV